MDTKDFHSSFLVRRSFDADLRYDPQAQVARLPTGQAAVENRDYVHARVKSQGNQGDD